MVSVASLWLPILASAALVFVVSSVIHMVLTYHKADMGPLPDEGAVAEALRPLDIPPGDYVIPYAADSKTLGSAAYIEKMNSGPVAFLTVLPNQPLGIGRSLSLWFGYCVVVGMFAGYVAGLALGPGAQYGAVFRIVSVVAFAGHSLAILHSSIWWYRSWSYTLKTMFDGLIFALLTGGTFGWLWP